jgi:hypothetical protein
MTNKKAISSGLLLALVTFAAVNLLPDLVRYMKIRSM